MVEKKLLPKLPHKGTTKKKYNTFLRYPKKKRLGLEYVFK